jgi:N-acetylglutamate synthase-like GNAT family acetyltransferase
VHELPGHYYWTALHEEKVVGTTGLIFISERNAVLKRMMVDKAYRGPETSTAKRLLETSVKWAKDNHIEHIYLGTMEQFHAARQFYSREGFVEIPIQAIPLDMPINPLDTVYFRLDMV